MSKILLVLASMFFVGEVLSQQAEVLSPAARKACLDEHNKCKN